MSNNITVPHALTMTLDEEREAFAQFIQMPATQDLRQMISMDKDDLDNVDLSFEGWLEQDDEANAPALISRLNEAIEYADGLANGLKCMRDSYVESMGVPEATAQVVELAKQTPTREIASALRYAMELQADSVRRMSREVRESLLSLGMPGTRRGRVVKTYQDLYAADRTWLENLVKTTADKPSQCRM